MVEVGYSSKRLHQVSSHKGSKDRDGPSMFAYDLPQLWSRRLCVAIHVNHNTVEDAFLVSWPVPSEAKESEAVA